MMQLLSLVNNLNLCGDFVLLTYVHGLFVVPVTVMINHGVLPVPVIHLSYVGPQLVGLWPVLLRCLSVEMSDTFHICGSK